MRPSGSLLPCPACLGRGFTWEPAAEPYRLPDGDRATHEMVACTAGCDLGVLALPLRPELAAADVDGRLGSFWTHPADADSFEERMRLRRVALRERGKRKPTRRPA